MEYRVIIADDDEGMRLVLKKVLEKSEGFVVAGEAENGELTVNLVESLKPHIVFLDVEMPILDGIECAKRIADINPKTILIFATAHEEYMPEAFEVYAFDYLVKPFNIERIKKTLERIKSLSTGLSSSLPVQPLLLPQKRLNKLLIRNKEGISVVNIPEIVLVQREARSTVIYTSSERYVTSETLSDIEDKLDRTIFFRSHKSYIINLSLVSRIYPYGRWTYMVKLKNTDLDALMTHEKYEELEKLFSSQ